VTIAAGRLQQLNLIHYSRGRVQILDRKGLEAISCPCYAEQLRIYRARMGKANGLISQSGSQPAAAS
jgi:hypothetical protein